MCGILRRVPRSREVKQLCEPPPACPHTHRDASTVPIAIPESGHPQKQCAPSKLWQSLPSPLAGPCPSIHPLLVMAHLGNLADEVALGGPGTAGCARSSRVVRDGHPEERVPGTQLTQPLAQDGGGADHEGGAKEAAVVQATQEGDHLRSAGRRAGGRVVIGDRFWWVRTRQGRAAGWYWRGTGPPRGGERLCVPGECWGH
jgi:hypothetical protein